MSRPLVQTPRTDPAARDPLTTGAPSGGEPFVVSTHKVRDRAAPTGWRPYGVEHAWRAGTRRTLCGEWTTGWTVFWERRFSARPATACPRCVEENLPESSRRRLDRFEPRPA